MRKIKLFLAEAKHKGDAVAIQMRCGIRAALSDTRGESQNTSNAGGVIVSLVIIALVVGFATGFFQNTLAPWVQKEFKAISGT